MAVAGYHPELLLVSTGKDRYRGTRAIRLHVVAISAGDQGRFLADGRRVSDVVVETLMSEALVDRATEVLTAVVARENLRSIALCERHGLTSQIEYDSRHLRLSGHFRRQP